MTWTKELDEAAVLATKKGCYHVLLFYLLCGLAAIPTSFLVFSQVYIGISIIFRCHMFACDVCDQSESVEVSGSLNQSLSSLKGQITNFATEVLSAAVSSGMESSVKTLEDKCRNQELEVFTNATPEHWCAPPEELEGLAFPDEMLRNLTVPRENGLYETCRTYSLDMQALYVDLTDYFGIKNFTDGENGTALFLKIKALILSSDPDLRYEKILRVQDAIVAVQKEPIACANSWKFKTEHYSRTLVTEFLLVCNNEWLPRTSNTLFWMGSLVGNLFFGWISDKYGRRPTILLMIFLLVPICILASFPGNYWGYIVLRILGGLFFPALYQQPFILALELMPPATRTHTGIVVGMLFASGMCLLALLAFLLRDWFYLSLATSLPFILLFGCYWLIPESPRWLVGRGRIADAEKVLRNLAKKNGIILPHGFLLELHKKIKDEETQVPFQETEDHNMDRRINNMLSFKPEYRINCESNNENKENLEPITKEVSDLIQKSRSPRDAESLQEEVIKLHRIRSIHDSELQQRTTHTEYSLPNSLGRKSIQLVNRFLLNENEDILEKKKMDDQNSEGDCGASPLDVFRYPNIRKKFLILTFNWIALGVVYNSLSYNTPNLGVDDYLAFFIGGAVEIPSYFIAWQCMERYGRRWVLCIFLNLGGLACLSCAFVPETWPWVIVSLAMMGRLCAAASFAVFYVQIGELLPTVVRAQAMGASSVVAGIGLLTVPYIVALATYSRYLPLIIMGVLSVMAGVTSLFLPETLNQPLPQTLEDGEMFGRNFKLLSCVESRS